MRLPKLTEPEFHAEMVSIYTQLRDLHTNYVLPDPYQAFVAVLPFRVEEFHDGEAPAAGERPRRRYMVTQGSPLVEDEHVRPGVIPTHWNGIPFHRAVELNAAREAGSNPAARHAQGLRSLTNRWFGMSLPPDEEWVVVGYDDDGVAREARFEWQVVRRRSPLGGLDPLAATGEFATQLGIDAKTEIQRQVLKLLFSPDSIRTEKRMSRARDSGDAAAVVARSEGADPNSASMLPDVFDRFGPVSTPDGTFGYTTSSRTRWVTSSASGPCGHRSGS